MIVKFEFQQIQNFNIDSVSVIGSFNQYNAIMGRMYKRDNTWYLDVELKEGEYYYKFLINDQIKLNDPSANVYSPGKDNEVWSVLIMNHENKRLYNNTQYTVNIENYNITNLVHEQQLDSNKRDFNLFLDKKVVARFEFNNITGFHSATAVWCTPDGKIFNAAESILVSVEGNKSTFIWFILQIDDNNHTYPEGLWTLKLFIDGSYILEDRFNLSKRNTYYAGMSM